MTSIEIKSRSKRLKTVSTDELELSDTVGALSKLVSATDKIAENRLRFTIKDGEGKHTPLDKSKTLKEVGFTTQGKNVVYVKDLGMQIGYRATYIVEYLGPLLIHPVFYFITSVYGYGQFDHTATQKAAYAMVILHFLKREYESIRVHKFSNATMFIFNLFKNSSHYWLMSGVFLSYLIYRPVEYTENSSSLSKFLFHVNDWPDWVVKLLFGLWAFFEVSNLIAHKKLAGLRSGSNSSGYSIPYGYGFDLVSCPNYFFETMSWVTYSVLVGNWSAWLFMVIGTAQMYVWAVKRHQRLLRLFGDDYKKLNRKIFFPYIL